MTSEELAAVQQYALDATLNEKPRRLLTPESRVPLSVAGVEALFQSLEEEKLLLLPDLRNDEETLLVFSDYGGEHKSSRYVTYAFWFVGMNAFYAFVGILDEIRKEFGLDNPHKEIAYKSLKYGQLVRALPMILNAAEVARGFLLVVAVDKGLPSATSEGTKQELGLLVDQLISQGLLAREPDNAEKLHRIVPILAYTAAVLAAEGQNLFWMTDEDSIIANEEMLSDTAAFFKGCVDLFSPKCGKVGMGKPFAPQQEGLAIPDLAAGAVEAFFKTDLSDDPQVKDSANTILMWLAKQGIGLRKHVLKIDRGANGEPVVKRADLAPKEMPHDAVVIEVPLG